MAESWLRHLAGDRGEFFSAGTHPVGLNPGSVDAMAEVDIDIPQHRSKSAAEFTSMPIDYVITVCDPAPKRPVLIGQEPFASSIGVSTTRQPCPMRLNGDKYSDESATRLRRSSANFWFQ